MKDLDNCSETCKMVYVFTKLWRA